MKQNETRDMNGKKLEPGQVVNRWPLIGKKTGEPKVRTIESIAPMHSGGEDMVWFEEGGGAHHPRACEVLETRMDAQ